MMTTKATSSVQHNKDFEKISKAAIYPLGNWPTPLEKHPVFPNFYIKRDDLSGYGRGGIKTRKLEGFLGYYKERGIKNFVVIVPNLSNLRADLEKVATEAGISVHFIVGDDPPLPMKVRKESILGSTFKYSLVSQSMPIVAFHTLKTYLYYRVIKRQKVALSLPSITHPSSIMGSAKGLLEFYEQCKAQQIDLPRNVFISASAGGSAAGLILSSLIIEEQEQTPIQIHVVKVFPIPMKAWIYVMLLWTKWKYKLEVKVKWSAIKIYKPAGKVKYGSYNEAMANLIDSLKEKYDINIDHIYGAKSWSIMEAFAKNEYKNDGLVFWHCGFTPDSHFFK